MDVTLYAQKGNFFSFFNSPYYSHFNALAVDIYPDRSDLETFALSPVDGAISKIHEFKSLQPKHFEAQETEQLILITPRENPNIYIRMLHINCNLPVGAHVTVGDPLGTLVRSGFFDFWTDLHLHVEIRRLEEPLRARGGYPLEIINSGQNTLTQKNEIISLMKVKAVNENYVLVEVEEGLSKLGNFWGVKGTVNNQLGILDCGIPHYCHGGLHTTNATTVDVGDMIWLWGIIIGRATRVFKNLVHFKCSPISIYVDDFPIKGLSLYPRLGETKIIKLIPKFPHDFQNLKTGKNLCLKIVAEKINT